MRAGPPWNNIRTAPAQEQTKSTHLPLATSPSQWSIFDCSTSKGFDDYDSLVCSLQNTPLNTAAGTYTAISYTWNENERIWYGTNHEPSPQTILIDELAIKISGKVAAILVLVQKACRSLVWIDAICINQSDTEEKSQQVKFMGDIYASAFEVSAVLGSPDKTIGCFFDAANAYTGESDVTLTSDLDFGHVKLHLNDYWHRAWVFKGSLGPAMLYCIAHPEALRMTHTHDYTIVCSRRIFVYEPFVE